MFKLRNWQRFQTFYLFALIHLVLFLKTLSTVKPFTILCQGLRETCYFNYLEQRRNTPNSNIGQSFRTEAVIFIVKWYGTCPTCGQEIAVQLHMEIQRERKLTLFTFDCIIKRLLHIFSFVFKTVRLLLTVQ